MLPGWCRVPRPRSARTSGVPRNIELLQPHGGCRVSQGPWGSEAAGHMKGFVGHQCGTVLGLVALAGTFRLGRRALFIAGGHTASNAPDLFRPPKLSGAGPG